MGDDPGELMFGRVPPIATGEELSDALVRRLTTTMQGLICELREVFEFETQQFEKRLHSSPVMVPPSGKERSKKKAPRLPIDVRNGSAEKRGVHVPEEVFSEISSNRSDFQESIASLDKPRSFHEASNRHRKGRLSLETLERDMGDLAFKAKFGTGPSGDQSAFSPNHSIVPDDYHDTPRHSFEGQELNDASRIPLFRSRVLSVVPFLTARICGVLPWHKTKKWTMAYQWLLVMLLCSCIGAQGVEIFQSYTPTHVPDLCLTIGALLALLGCGALRQSKSLVDCDCHLDAYVQANNCQHLLDTASCIDIGSSLVAIVFIVGFRAIRKGSFDLQEGIFAFVSCLISAISCYLVRTCTTVAWMVDAYCTQMLTKQQTYTAAVKEWYLLDWVCRLVCVAIQFSFTFLQLTTLAMLVFLLVASFHGEVTLACTLSIALFALCTTRIWLYAALVSEKCRQVPRLFTTSGNGELDAFRAQVVEYIWHCQSGFYLFGMRVSFALTLKLMYSFSAACFALLSNKFY